MDAGVDAEVDAGVDGGGGCTATYSAPVAAYCGTFWPADTATTLQVEIDGCYCGEELLCSGTLEPDGAIELSVGICPSTVDCDECWGPAVVDCDLPPLPAGTWLVRQEGRDLGFITASAAPPPPFVRRTCTSTAPPVDEALVCGLPGRPTTAEQICFEGRRWDRWARVTVTDPCGSCFDQPGPCVVEGIPGGPAVTLRPETRYCDCPTCGACADVCVPTTTECLLPEDLHGLVQLYVGDRDLGTIDVDATGPWCAAMAAGGGGGGR